LTAAEAGRIVCDMFDRIRNWFRPAPKTQEDLDAQKDGRQIREDVETLRMGSLEGPPMYAHGGSESRGRKTPD
jgi:hypothetical protein